MMAEDFVYIRQFRVIEIRILKTKFENISQDFTFYNIKKTFLLR